VTGVQTCALPILGDTDIDVLQDQFVWQAKLRVITAQVLGNEHLRLGRSHITLGEQTLIDIIRL